MRRIKRDKPFDKIARGLEAATAGDYTVREIKLDKPNPGLAARSSEELTGRRDPLADSRGKNESAQILRTEPETEFPPNIIRLVSPRDLNRNPIEAWLSAMRDYQLHWLRIWSSWLPR